MHVNSNFLKVHFSNCAKAKNYYAHSILIMNHYHDVFVLQELSMYCKLRRIDTLFIVIVYCNLS